MKNDKTEVNPVHKLRDSVAHNSHALEELLKRERDSAFKRFPLVFTLLGTFGLVAVLYGFEHIIDEIPLLVENPFIMLGAGVVILLVTGTLYKTFDPDK